MVAALTDGPATKTVSMSNSSTMPISNSEPAMPRTTPGASISSKPTGVFRINRVTAVSNGRRKRPASSVQSASNASTCQLDSCHCPSDTVPGKPKPGDPGSAVMQKQVWFFPDNSSASSLVSVDLPIPASPYSKILCRPGSSCSARLEGQYGNNGCDAGWVITAI